ncbi:MAG: hypothetical protein NTX91_00135 [candidate division SR1 bacterium]|nr:hypothetical protein [candidate division SR1 bacterium]
MFTLLAKQKEDPKFKAFLEKIIPNHDCETCEAKGLCPLPSIKMVVEKWMSTKNPDFNEIKKIIKKEIKNADFIIVMDDVEDTCYIFKAEGDLAEIKKTTLKEALINYEKIERTHVFFSEVRDVRDQPITVEKKKKAEAPAEEKE